MRTICAWISQSRLRTSDFPRTYPTASQSFEIPLKMHSRAENAVHLDPAIINRIFPSTLHSPLESSYLASKLLSV